jgi:hypothetical protein
MNQCDPSVRAEENGILNATIDGIKRQVGESADFHEAEKVMDAS